MKSSNSLVRLPLKSQVEAEICRRSYYEFFKLAWHVLEPENPFEDNWHVKYLCDILQTEVERISRKESKTSDLVINIPPRSLKSYIVTIMLNAWTWISYPHMHFITSSYSGDLATEHAVKTRRLIESQWYQERFNTFEMTTDQNVKSRYENNKGGGRRATSVGGTVTGGGCDILIADDPHKVSEVNSETVRKSALDWWGQTMYSRLNDLRVGLRVVVMQRLHQKDLTGFILSEELDYRHICIPSVLADNVSPEGLSEHYTNELFFESRFTADVLEDTRKNLGSLAYAGQYLQKPSPPEGNIIKANWFKWVDKSELPAGIVVNAYTDAAYGKEKSDNSATVLFSQHEGDVYIWACHAWNLGLPAFCSRYASVMNQSGVDGRSRLYFEPKASGISAVQTIKTTTNLNVMEDQPPTESKMSRVQSISATIEAGRVKLIRGGAGLEDMIGEATVFPNGDKDDMLDALTGALIVSNSVFKFVKNY